MFTTRIDNELQLALIEESFAAAYANIVSTQQEYLLQWLAWPEFCNTEQDFRLFAQRSLHDYADGKSLLCAIWFRDRLVGNAGFNCINHDLQQVEIGYWLSKEEQGQGIMTRVVDKLCEIAFRQMGMQKVQLRAAVKNYPSRAVAERLGMTLEGIITRSEKIQGRILDHAVYALSVKDFKH